MRTKNAKRLWPVPATLTVVALAALLAFGLMATTGAQPTGAQSDDPCVTVMADDNATVTARTPDIATTANNADGDDGCNSAVTPAVIELEGQTSQAETALSNFVIYGPGIGGSGSHVYPPATVYGDHDDNAETDDIFYTGTPGPDAVRVEPLPAIAIQVGPGTVDIGGTAVGSTKTFTVAGTPPKTVTVYVAQGTEFTELIGGDSPETAGKASAVLTANRVQQLDIIFLGAPAVGKDLPSDFNNKIDDVVSMQQCHLTSDTTRMRLVGEVASCSAEDPPGALTPGDWTAIDPNPDVTESRSKLVVRTGDAAATTDVATPLIDGKMVTHTLEGTTQDTVTIYALIEDGAGKALLDTEVSFRSTTMPAGIVAQRDLSDDMETKSVISIPSGDLMRDEIRVEGLDPDDDTPTVGAAIDNGDAVAAYMLDGLPSEADDAYRITVEVMAGNVKIGTVVIERTGDPVVLKAGVFNADCLTPGTADNYSDAKVDLTNDDCDDSGMLRRFGADDVIVVKAHLEDSLGSVVGRSSDLGSELADDFDDPLDLDGPDTIVDPVTGKIMPKAWVYVVDEDAQLGNHMITVSTTKKNADEEAIDDVTLTIIVAGPPTQYMFVDPVDNIELGSRAMFTVQAYDAVGGTPHFGATADDNKVEVFIQGLPNGNTRNVDAAGMLTLNKDTGMGTFTIFAPNTAEDGDTIRIFVASGAMEQQIEVTFGDPDVTPDPMERDEFTADYTVTATSTAGSGMVDVSWTRSEGLTLSLVSLIRGDKVVDFNITGLTSTEFSGVDPGEYDVSVFSFRITEDGEKDGEIAFGTVTVE